jgi:hypothetical protein
MVMAKWIIVDWTSTRCFSDKRFKSYEDAWEFLYSEFPSTETGDDREDELGEYYVIKDTEPHRERIGGLVIDTIPNQYSSNKCLENQKVNQIESWK